MAPSVELALIFLRLGTTAFGGPAAHIAMMRQEFVERRQWVTEQEYLDLVGASNLIPGPSSTEVAIHIGMRRCGWVGLLLAGVCFILPAALIVTAVASLYVRYGQLPRAQAIFYGIKPVIVSVVAQALWNLGKMAWKTRASMAIGLIASACSAVGVNMLGVLFGSGLVLAVRQWLVGEKPRTTRPLGVLVTVGAILAGFPVLIGALGGHADHPNPSALLWVFLKIGAALYGSGYVLLAFLRTTLVDQLHWLSLSQVLDATAVGQLTPGPVFTTATFIGYIVAGPLGALATTIGIFLPAFIFVAISGPLVPRLREESIIAAFLDGVNAASVALMATVTFALARAALVDFPTIAIAAVTGLALVLYRVNSAWLVLAGALTGLVLAVARHG